MHHRRESVNKTVKLSEQTVKIKILLKKEYSFVIDVALVSIFLNSCCKGFFLKWKLRQDKIQTL